MITIGTGDILKTDCEALVNTVNTQGFMGKGVALAVKNRYPDNFGRYKIACDSNQFGIGQVLLVETKELSGPRYILNFPTKREWRKPSRLDYIARGLEALKTIIIDYQITSVAIPPLGCGNGGLDWSEVRPLIETALQPLGDCRIVLFEPSPMEQLQAKEQEPNNHPPPQMTVGRAALLVLMNHYRNQGMAGVVTLVEIQKLLYFLQEVGQDLRLDYDKGTYGPYAVTLGKVLQHMEGHTISGYSGCNDQPYTIIEFGRESARQAEAFLRDHPETVARIDQVKRIIEGFEDSLGVELLATVHWLVKRDGLRTLEAITRGFYNWNESKARFSKTQIAISYNSLIQRGYLPTEPPR